MTHRAHFAATTAAIATLRPRTLCGTVATARLASNAHIEVHLARSTANGFGEAHLHVEAEIVARRRTGASRTTRRATKEAFKEILNRTKITAAEATRESAAGEASRPARSAASTAAWRTTNSCLTEAVVARTLLRIREHLICVVQLLELRRSVRCLGDVGVVLLRRLAEGLLDVVRTCRLRHAEDRVEVASHRAPTSAAACRAGSPRGDTPRSRSGRGSRYQRASSD